MVILGLVRRSGARRLRSLVIRMMRVCIPRESMSVLEAWENVRLGHCFVVKAWVRIGSEGHLVSVAVMGNEIHHFLLKMLLKVVTEIFEWRRACLS